MPQWRVHCLLNVNHLIKSIISGRSLELIRGEMKMCGENVKKVKGLIDKPLDGPCRPWVTVQPHELELEDVRLAMVKVRCPRK